MRDLQEFARQLIAGLTREQLVGFLTELLNMLPDTAWKELSKKLERDTAAVFDALRDPDEDAAVTEDECTSDAKFAEEFHSAMAALTCLQYEVGDEDGDYVVQEHDWEAPDFDSYKLTADMEQAAEDLLPLLERAAKLELEEPDAFLTFAKELTEAIDSYPEYIYTEEGVEFGEKATECVLKWLDLHAEDEHDFLCELLNCIDNSGMVDLCDGAISRYVLHGWPEDRRKAFYAAIEKRREQVIEFCELTNTPRNLWHNIRFSLANEFDQEVKEEIAEAALEKDWTMGLPLIEAALAKNDFDRASEFCRRTVQSLYCRYQSGLQNCDFDPAKTPIIPRWNFNRDSESTHVSRILRIWSELARKNGNVQLAELLAIQDVLYMKADDWSAVREVFKQAENADTSALFSVWKTRFLAERHLSFGGEARLKRNWIGWLIDAGFAGSFLNFTDKALQWLNEKAEYRNLAGGQLRLPAQMSLIADLFRLQAAPKEYPTLTERLKIDCQLEDCPAREEWLAQADTAKLTAAALAFMRRNISRIVPSPELMSSDYSCAAGWLAAARELAPEQAEKLLQNWRVAFKRKRNLWRDLRSHGFNA